MKRYLLLFAVLALFTLTGCKWLVQEVPTAAPVQNGESSEEIATFLEPPTPTGFGFETNRYAVSVDAAAYLGSAAEDYKTLIDTVCAGKTDAAAASAENAHRAAVVFASSPYSAFADVQVTDAAFSITYTGSGDAETFDNAVKALVEEKVFEESNSVEKAIGLYEAVAVAFSARDNAETTLYQAMLEKKGSEQALAEVLNYLFIQNGIPSRVATGTMNGNEHFWVIAELNGNSYHFDPLQEHGQATLRGFAMSDAKYMELFDEAAYTTGQGEYAAPTADLCPDTTFDPLFRGTTAYKLDTVNHYIYLSTDSSGDYQKSVNTETLGAAVG